MWGVRVVGNVWELEFCRQCGCWKLESGEWVLEECGMLEVVHIRGL